MEIDCFLSPHVDLYVVGRVLAGLYSQPKAKVRLKLVDWMPANDSVAFTTGGTRFGIQLSDHRDVWDKVLLDWCDVYAKRSLHRDFPAPLHSQKVVPYGFHCSGSSRRSKRAVFSALLRQKPTLVTGRSLELYRYGASLHWRRFEHPPEGESTATILFQTRLWEPDEAPGDTGINEERICLVDALKREFGTRFRGGLQPTKLALELRPDLVTTEPTRQAEYISRSRAPLIGVYSRGLFGSQAFKMAEYLASSKCIVTEPIANVVEPGLGTARTFLNVDECVSQCQTLLSNPVVAHELRAESWRYYVDFVRPSAVVRNLIKRAV